MEEIMQITEEERKALGLSRRLVGVSFHFTLEMKPDFGLIKYYEY